MTAVAVRLSETALTSQLEALRNQINHHFLFNSLNVIAETTTHDPERAEGLVIQLADVLRYSLGATKRRLAPLSDEIAAVKEALRGIDAAQSAVQHHAPHEVLLLELYSALKPVDAVTGATSTDDILALIFAGFCIGK